ncbi:MAG: GFA family protein [Pseudomonadota bacterium]
MTSPRGSCLCGAVTYRADAPLRPVVACHCAQCRKTSGHHVAATAVDRDALHISGNVTWFASSDTAERGFCGICGSNLFWDAGGDHVSIFAGTLDRPTDLKIAGHIYCADKGDYYAISDGAPKAAGNDFAMTDWVQR